MHSFEKINVWYLLWLPEHIFNWCMLWKGKLEINENI